MASSNKRRRPHNSPSKASQEYILNIDLARRCKCAGCTDTFFMDLNDRVVLGCSAKHTICVKCITEEVASADCDNKLTCPCCKEKKKEFTYHQRNFSQQRSGVSSKNIT